MSNKGNNPQKTTKILYVVTAVLAIIAIALFVTGKNTEAALTQEKEQIVSELKSLESEYDKVVTENKTANDELTAAKNQVAQFLDSISGLNADIATLSKFRTRVYILNKQHKELLAKIAELEAANAKLTQERDETYAALEEQTEANKELVAQNVKLADAVKRGSALNLSAYNVQAVKERSNGSFRDVRRANPTDAFKVCYTVAENAIATAGERKFYVEVITPAGSVLNSQSASNAEGASINYSKATSFNYENMSIDVCDYVRGEEFAKGNYMVNVYDENLRLLGTSSFTLK